MTRVTDTGGNGVFYGNEEFVRNTTNSGNSCAYDANGNRLYDSNSNIWGIRYNLLNLPDAMQFYQGHQTNYTYSASGAKLKVVDKTAPAGAELPVTSLNTVLTNPSVAMTTTTDYVGNMIYENGTLKRILTPVGYWQDGIYYYFLKDHLGSNRVVMTGSGSIAETSSYYPSGMRFGESAVNGGSVQPYRHTGHEMQEMHGLNWIDNLARFRTVNDGSGFTGMDPLAEIDCSVSPYSYCKGNPIKRIDPTGMTSTEEYMEEHGGAKAYNRVYTAPESNEGNKVEKPNLINDLKESVLNFFGFDLNPDNPKDRKKIDEGSKNRVKAAEIIDETNKFLIINGVLFFAGEGATYCIERFGGAILVRIVGKSIGESGVTVLGTYNEVTGGYAALAEKMGANYFQVPNWAWNILGKSEQWGANVRFLDASISRGDSFVLSNSAFTAKQGTAYYKEIQYLLSKGYKIADNGMSLFKP